MTLDELNTARTAAISQFETAATALQTAVVELGALEYLIQEARGEAVPFATVPRRHGLTHELRASAEIRAGVIARADVLRDS